MFSHLIVNDLPHHFFLFHVMSAYYEFMDKETLCIKFMAWIKAVVLVLLVKMIFSLGLYSYDVASKSINIVYIFSNQTVRYIL